jgi:hypothetical protein
MIQCFVGCVAQHGSTNPQPAPDAELSLDRRMRKGDAARWPGRVLIPQNSDLESH